MSDHRGALDDPSCRARTAACVRSRTWGLVRMFVPFKIGGTVNIPRGTYDFADLQLVYTMPTGLELRTDVDFRAGTYFDGERAPSRFELPADPVLSRARSSLSTRTRSR